MLALELASGIRREGGSSWTREEKGEEVCAILAALCRPRRKERGVSHGGRMQPRSERVSGL